MCLEGVPPRPFRPASQKAGSAGLDPGPGNQASKTQGLPTWQQALTTSPQGPQNKCQLLGPPTMMIRGQGQLVSSQASWWPQLRKQCFEEASNHFPFWMLLCPFPTSIFSQSGSSPSEGMATLPGMGVETSLQSPSPETTLYRVPMCPIWGEPKTDTPQCSVLPAENPTGETSLAADRYYKRRVKDQLSRNPDSALECRTLTLSLASGGLSPLHVLQGCYKT